MSDSAITPSAFLPSDICPTDELLQTVLEISLTAVMLLRPEYTPDGKLADFTIQYLNPAGQRRIKLPEQPKGTLVSHFPHVRDTGVLDFYTRVFETNETLRYSFHYQHDGLENYFHLIARRTGKLLLVNFTDTPDQDRSEVEQALRESQVREQAARAEAELQRQQLHNILMEAPALICIFEGPQHVFKLVNPPYQQLVGERPILGRPITEAMPELVGQPIIGWLDKVYQTGESLYAHETLVQLDHQNSGTLGHNYYNFIYQATQNLSGEIDGIMVFAYEVTTQVQARQQVQALNEKLETRVAERTQQVAKAQAQAEQQKIRLERLFMEAPAAICILDGPDLVYELVNPSYQQLFPNRELLGKPVLEALPEIIDNSVYRTFQKVYQTGKTHEEKALHIPLYRPHDNVLEDRYFNFIQQARLDEYGRPDGVLVFAFEVTDQVQARQASEASAHQLRLLTNALPVLIGYLDKEEKYRFANQAYQAWFNQNPEELLGRPVAEVVGHKAYHGVKGYIDRALAGERLDFEATMPYRENFTKHIRTSYIPDIQNGEVKGFYTMLNDITEQVEARQLVEQSEQQAKKLARELAAANEELKTTNQQLTHTNVDLDNFIYTASHDLKAPILNIEGLMEALQENLSQESLQSETVHYIINLITNSVQRFKRTIDHLTELTKLQKENSADASSVQLAEIIAGVQLDLTPQIKSARAQIEVNVTQCSTIRFSEKNLRSIVYNLLSNAIKYHAPERVPFVQVHCHETNEYRVLTVQDNGLGMDLTDKHKIFAMFQRLHNHVEGSGIGLYMVKRILENAGGKIEVESKVSEGSVFRVYFPLGS